LYTLLQPKNSKVASSNTIYTLPSPSRFDSSFLKLYFVSMCNEQWATSQYLHLHKTWKIIIKCTLYPYHFFTLLCNDHIVFQKFKFLENYSNFRFLPNKIHQCRSTIVINKQHKVPILKMRWSEHRTINVSVHQLKYILSSSCYFSWKWLSMMFPKSTSITRIFHLLNEWMSLNHVLLVK
jgi:hypothetical protein